MASNQASSLSLGIWSRLYFETKQMLEEFLRQLSRIFFLLFLSFIENHLFELETVINLKNRVVV